MRRFVLLILIVFVLTIPVCAHPGGTDGNGGHYDHSTGEYHYHHGYGAHDHEDLDGDGVLDCPHNFKDKTGESSGQSSGSGSRYPASTRPPTPPAVPEYTRPTYSSDKSKSLGAGSIWESILTLAVAPLVIMAFICIFSAAEREPTSRSRPYHGPPVWEDRPDRAPVKAIPPPKPPDLPKNVPLNDRTRLDQFLREYNPDGIIKVKFPPELRMAEDGTLYWGVRTPDKPFGNGTAYITGRSGRCWHMKCGCNGAKKPIFIPAALRKYRPCGICVPSQFRSLQVPDWYYKYTRLRNGHFRPRQLSFFDENKT